MFLKWKVQYRKLAEQLLGNVFIADDETAMENSNAQYIGTAWKICKGKYTLSVEVWVFLKERK
jgi:chromosome segregation protein